MTPWLAASELGGRTHLANIPGSEMACPTHAVSRQCKTAAPYVSGRCRLPVRIRPISRRMLTIVTPTGHGALAGSQAACVGLFTSHMAMEIGIQEVLLSCKVIYSNQSPAHASKMVTLAASSHRHRRCGSVDNISYQRTTCITSMPPWLGSVRPLPAMFAALQPC